MNHQPRYVLDTHILVWQWFKPKSLSATTIDILNTIDRFEAQAFVPAVVLAELSMIAQKNRVTGLNAGLFPVLLSALEKHAAYTTTVLSVDIILASQAFSTIPDIFDRLIATEAALLGAKLVTVDPIIINSGLVATVP